MEGFFLKKLYYHSFFYIEYSDFVGNCLCYYNNILLLWRNL